MPKSDDLLSDDSSTLPSARSSHSSYSSYSSSTTTSSDTHSRPHILPVIRQVQGSNAPCFRLEILLSFPRQDSPCQPVSESASESGACTCTAAALSPEMENLVSDMNSNLSSTVLDIGSARCTLKSVNQHLAQACLTASIEAHCDGFEVGVKRTLLEPSDIDLERQVVLEESAQMPNDQVETRRRVRSSINDEVLVDCNWVAHGV